MENDNSIINNHSFVLIAKYPKHHNIFNKEKYEDPINRYYRNYYCLEFPEIMEENIQVLWYFSCEGYIKNEYGDFMEILQDMKIKHRSDYN